LSWHHLTPRIRISTGEGLLAQASKLAALFSLSLFESFQWKRKG